jgi:hypothetical protein
MQDQATLLDKRVLIKTSAPGPVEAPTRPSCLYPITQATSDNL